VAASFEAPIDPAAGPLDADGFDSFAGKKAGLDVLRKRSSVMWADQRI
jgi:hypothetical protein